MTIEAGSPLAAPDATSPLAAPATTSPLAAPATTSPLAPLVTFGRMIKFEHTIFALPFALAAAAIAARGHGLSVARVAGIVVAMAAARTAAMGFNRIADRHIDAKNPRTARRELPAGAVTLRAAWILTLAAAATFVAAAAYLGPLCLALSPVALAFLFGYSFTKRFTFLCHLFLGLAIASGPAGAWIAVRGDFGLVPGLLMLAVACWIAGFDVLYALADRDFDRGAGLHSIPARFGVTGALVISAGLHAVTLGALLALGPVAALGAPYFVGVAIVAALLVYEHAIVRPSDLSRLDAAFFTLNGYVSVVFFVATLGDVLLR
jgi:4-hydroxybenzoate polyprenyltransferase